MPNFQTINLIIIIIITMKILIDCVISHTALTNLYFDGENKRIIVTNKNGNVFVYDVTKPLPSVIQTHQTVSKNAIRGFHYDPLKNFVFTGSIDDGEICVFDIKKPGKVPKNQFFFIFKKIRKN